MAIGVGLLGFVAAFASVLVPWARIGEFVGQRSLAVTADTYTHVLTDETELSYAELLAKPDPGTHGAALGAVLTR
jgi:hypothetical protein